MIKDHFQRSSSTLNNLRSEHFKISQYLNKGKYRLKQKQFGKDKIHYDFDLNSQEFFHEQVDDIIFQQPDTQETFYQQIQKTLDFPVTFNNKCQIQQNTLETRKNPSEVRVLLARHFKNRGNDLEYKKYLTMLRLHNLPQQEDHISSFKSRTNLIDKQIQQCLSRSARLQIQDYFQSSYVQGGKPVPINQNGQPIYKYLDEEQCWFSNINREDIQVYLRNLMFREEIMNKEYWGYWHQWEYLVFGKGLQVCGRIQKEFARRYEQNKEIVIINSKKLISLLETGLQNLSPGNLIEKEHLSNFIFTIMGVTNEVFLIPPFYPAVFIEVCQSYNKMSQNFFKNINLSSHNDIINIIPKFNSFCSIIFKYQNQEILEGQKQIKLGLQDDIDVQKQLITLLQQHWVKKYVKIDFQRFDHRLYLESIDWELDTLSLRLENQVRMKNNNGYSSDSSLEELVRAARLTTYSDFRKIMKRRSEKIVNRLGRKYQDLQLCQMYFQKSQNDINMQKLSDLYKVKQTKQIKSKLRESTKKFLDLVIRDHIVSNPVEIEMLESLSMIKVRQLRTKAINILNAIRNYQRNIDMDLRVIDGCEFKFKMDDDFLINSNKQVLQNFQKQIRETQNMISKQFSSNAKPTTLPAEDFLMNGKIQKQILYKKNKIQLHFHGENVPHAFVIDPKKRSIMYSISLQDLKIVEERIIQIGTFFINKYERIIKMKNLAQIVDRTALLAEIFDLEVSYLYEKFALIESYYYLYENTTEPLNAHKIAKSIIKIIYEQPKIDFNSDYFKTSYLLIIDALRKENELVKTLTHKIENEQKEKGKVFHKKFSDITQIPLTLWAYAYGDIQIKGNKNHLKLQRNNTVTSRMSRHSRGSENEINKVREQIRQQFEQYSSEQEEQQAKFDLKDYDQYMLKRNMDDIFEQIVGGNHAAKEEKKQKQQKANAVGSSLGTQNIMINPKFQGGPYVLLNYLPQIPITSKSSQKVLNFSQIICCVANIRHVINKLAFEGKERYGFCSQQYFLNLRKVICEMMMQILLTSPPSPETIYEIQTDDFYHETVSKDMVFVEEMLQPIIDLPSALQLSIQSTHQKHQSTLPHFQNAQILDIAILSKLIKLQKPVNLAVYRQLNLSINLLEFVRIRQRMFHLQLQRDQIIYAYQNLGQNCDIPIDKFSQIYGRSGQSQVFLATSESKVFSNLFSKRPSFNSSISQLRTLYQLEQADILLLKSFVQICKQQIEEYIRLNRDIRTNQVNHIIDRRNILLSLDKKNVTMVGNRIQSEISSLGLDKLKNNCFFKYKLKLRNTFEQKIKTINETNFEDIVWNSILNNDHKKYSKNSVFLLTEKIRQITVQEFIKRYTLDLKHHTANNNNFLSLLNSIKKLKNYIHCMPYLSKILIAPTQFQTIAKKAFYDQKKLKIVQQKIGLEGESILYIQSKEQVLDNWILEANLFTNLMKQIDFETFVKSKSPPASKDLLFKWMFDIPANNIQEKDKQSIRHLLKVYEPFTGKSSPSEYRSSPVQKGSRNKFTELYERYTTMIEYIQSNIILIGLQVDDDIFDSLQDNIEQGINFEEKYPLIDQASIYQTSSKQENDFQNENQGIMAPCFIYENRKDQLEKSLLVKITSRGYTHNKLHWAVIDEILDFIISKVQGYGVIRRCFLEFKDQVSLFEEMKIENVLSYMRNKTSNFYMNFWLSLWDLYNSKNEDTNIYVSMAIDKLVHIPKLEDFQAIGNKNSRRGITEQILNNPESILQEKNRFHLGVFELHNNFLDNKLKVPFNFVPINIEHRAKSFFKELQTQNSFEDTSEHFLQKHNPLNMEQFFSFIKLPGKDFRFKLFARLRENYVNSKNMILLNTPSTNSQQLMELENKKVIYFTYIMQARIYMIALTTFKMAKFSQSYPDTSSKFWQVFHENLLLNRQIVQLNTFNIFDQLQTYQSSNKIVFSKTQSTIIGSKTIDRTLPQQCKLVRLVISSKLTIEQFKNQLLEVAIRLLKAQNYPKNQQKKIQNTSLLPRVHIISSFSSPIIVDRRTYISQQYKIAFVQAFINRFRNKVSRVDLLSSGYGFVITVPDLEDCMNFMNKLLFTFTEKQFKSRTESFSLYYEVLIEAVKNKNKTIQNQSCIIKHLQDKVNNILEAEYLSKVSKLLQQKVVMEQKFKLLEQTSNGLQHRIRKTVQNQYELKISSLQLENNNLKEKFTQFKDIFVKLTKDNTKNNFLSLVNMLRDKVSETLDKKIDMSESFKSIKQMTLDSKIKQNINVKHQQPKNQNASIEKEYIHSDIQKCQIGQDIVHDPYYVTKLINKMRIFNIFKMGVKRVKFENMEQKKIAELTSLHKIQDRVISQNQRQIILRDELNKAQQDLSLKSIELQRIKHDIQNLENQKTKLKVLLMAKQKKIQQKERENQEIKKKVQKIQQRGEISSKKQIKQIQEFSRITHDDLPKIGTLRTQKRSRKKIQKQAFITHFDDRSISMSLYEKFEMSNKQSSWKQKCEELYLENKKLLAELEKIKEDNTSGANFQIVRDGLSLNMRQKKVQDTVDKNSSRSEKKKFPNLSFKYGMMKG